MSTHNAGVYAAPRPCQGTCGRTMVSAHAWRAGEHQGADTYHRGNEQCPACYYRAKRAAKAPETPQNARRRPWSESVAPRVTRKPEARRSPKPSPEPRYVFTPREELVAEYDHIRESVHSIREAAMRMGVSFTQLDKALYRARKTGDERAMPPVRQRERAMDAGAPFGRSNPYVPRSDVA